MPVLPKADVSVLGSFVSPRATRQMDHFTRMGLCAAHGALTDAGLQPEHMRDAGLVLATGYGPASPTFTFLDSIEEYGARMASPLSFSHSLHNIPAASIAMKLGMEGPCASFCQVESSVASGLLAALSWLMEGRVSRVLFGAVDELTPLLIHVTEQIVSGKEKSGESGRRDLPLGEGAVFFCLSTGCAKRGTITDISLTSSFGAAKHRAAFQATLGQMAAYGNIPIAQAFDMLAALAAFEAGEQRDITCNSWSPAGAESMVLLAPPGGVR
ncbi:beta-ketoacyl synthase chain length factor [Desulfovibrio sp. OttesenSCG-928-O18]|nr:beta-ketoacyl synthase chain length factor [Desulfovibrio sp. OttesenSCG-928-O18]